MISKETITISHPYLSFRLGDEIFAVNVAKVLEILEITKITKVPKSPDYMRGVINLRGSVLPVIDTRAKFDMELTTDTVNTCIMVLNIEMDGENLVLGALVDAVQEVLEIGKEQIKPAPTIGSKYKSEFIDGMVKIDEQFIMLLNMDRVLSSNELIMVKDSTSQPVV
ncbi:chemotaxis protein CheW [Rhodocytophaga rosea]|uniref:Chemotaxis protein CheW n=1 Tax=Rhodocytophaga rosea TaxID=2704465 RepID=A0A6C0GK01_9BACT|nr:chemotaxis protein CheW [Rhodocytophaga rosea]QHT68144.1 chemotaxis protein CheW [Rhodocytophaga rosea]